MGQVVGGYLKIEELFWDDNLVAHIRKRIEGPNVHFWIFKSQHLDSSPYSIGKLDFISWTQIMNALKKKINNSKTIIWAIYHAAHFQYIRTTYWTIQYNNL